jgi:hypothetical protein
MRDPFANLLRIVVHQKIGPLPAGHLMAGSVGHPGGMKTEPRARRHAKVVARNDAQDHGAGRKAGAVNNDVLAGFAQVFQFVEVGADLAAGIGGDAYGC